MPDAEKSLTVNEFCEAEKICRATFYNILNAGRGPDVMRVAGRLRITPEARRTWHQKSEREERESAEQRRRKTKAVSSTGASE